MAEMLRLLEVNMLQYIDTMQSKNTQEYFDIHDRRIPDLDEYENCVLSVDNNAGVTLSVVATDDEYLSIINNYI